VNALINFHQNGEIMDESNPHQKFKMAA